MIKITILILISFFFSCKGNLSSDPKPGPEELYPSTKTEDSLLSTKTEDWSPSKMEKLYISQEYDSMILEFKKNRQEFELYSVALFYKNRMDEYEKLMEKSIKKLVIDSALRNIGVDYPVKRDSFVYFYKVKGINSNVTSYEAYSLLLYTTSKYNEYIKNGLLMGEAYKGNPSNEIFKFGIFNVTCLNEEVTYPESRIDYINRLIKLYPCWSHLYDVKLDLILDRAPRIEFTDNDTTRKEILDCLKNLVSQNYYEENCSGSPNRTKEIKNLMANFNKTDINKINQIVNYRYCSNHCGVDYMIDK